MIYQSILLLIVPGLIALKVYSKIIKREIFSKANIVGNIYDYFILSFLINMVVSFALFVNGNPASFSGVYLFSSFVFKYSLVAFMTAVVIGLLYSLLSFDFKSYIAELKILMNETKSKVNKKEDTLK